MLITGAAGSGKSTTLACLIDAINHSRSGHIITIEDPIEVLHRHQKSIVSQREIGQDTPDYIHALTAALREAPDVILVGEMRESGNDADGAVSGGNRASGLFLAAHDRRGKYDQTGLSTCSRPRSSSRSVYSCRWCCRRLCPQQLIPAVGGGLIPALKS